jgi:hypothetical protein
MYLINTYQWEWTTIAALVAPRPLLFANSDKDRIFPMDGNRRIIERLRKLYAMHGKPALVDEYVSQGGHDYRPDLRVAVFKWINRHIKGAAGDVKDADFKPLPGEQLRVFAEDKDIPKDAINGRIDETFVPRAQVKLPEAGKFEEWKQGLLKELREQSFRPFANGIPPAKWEKREFSWDGKKEWAPVLVTAPGIDLYGGPVRRTGEVGMLYVVDSSERGEKSKADNHLPAGKNYWYLMPRGLTDWTRKSPPNYHERAHALLGQTVDQGSVWDIIATVRHLKESEKVEVTLLGVGQAGILAAYAALFEPSIKEVVIVDPPASHREGPTFLNVLRVLDIPEALGLLAPTPLTLVNAKDKAFDRTAAIYKIAGAEAKFQRK